jgi:hypothetical protein
MDVATERAASTEIRKGEGGCLFDEIQDLVEPTERRTTESPARPAG